MRPATVVLSACLVAALSTVAAPAHAQEVTTELPPDDRWSATLAPYLWMISLDGDASVGGLDADVDVPFSDSIKDLSFGGMLLGSIRKGRLGFALNGVFTRVSPDDEVGAFDLDVTTDLAQLAVAPFYRVVDWQFGETASGRPLKVILEPYAGARLNHLRVEIEVRGGRQVDDNQTWVDPIVGSRFGVDISDRLAFFGAADIGGVVTGSDLSWNLQGYLGYRTTFFGRDTVLTAGYRAFYTDYEDGNFEWDVTQHGPILGTVIRF
jgi:hypothetical protein